MRNEYRVQTYEATYTISLELYNELVGTGANPGIVWDEDDMLKSVGLTHAPPDQPE